MTNINKIPDDETGKVNYDDMFRRNTGIDTIMGVDKEDGYTYKGVITNYPSACGPELVHNFEMHRKAGFEIYLSTTNIKDDRVFGPNSNERPISVPRPVTGKTDDGFEYVVMRIRTTDLDKHLRERQEKEYAKYLASVGGKVTKGKYSETQGFSAVDHQQKDQDSYI